MRRWRATGDGAALSRRWQVGPRPRVHRPRRRRPHAHGESDLRLTLTLTSSPCPYAHCETPAKHGSVSGPAAAVLTLTGRASPPHTHPHLQQCGTSSSAAHNRTPLLGRLSSWPHRN
eukprot:3183770-Prymnesium_polylepis.1